VATGVRPTGCGDYKGRANLEQYALPTLQLLEKATISTYNDLTRLFPAIRRSISVIDGDGITIRINEGKLTPEPPI